MMPRAGGTLAGMNEKPDEKDVELPSVVILEEDADKASELEPLEERGGLEPD